MGAGSLSPKGLDHQDDERDKFEGGRPWRERDKLGRPRDERSREAHRLSVYGAEFLKEDDL